MSGERRYVARGRERLGDVLWSMKLQQEEARAALEEGRVFVGPKRAQSFDAWVEQGHVVRVHAPRATVAMPEPFLLHVDDDFVIVHKPTGIPTVPDLIGAAGSLQDLAARAAGEQPNRLMATSRLDADVSGVVTFARGEAAYERVSHARAHGRYARRYVAVGAGVLSPPRASWRWSIGRDRDPKRRRAVDPLKAARDDKPACSEAWAIDSVAGPIAASILALAPITGRTHQLRVHAAAASIPLFGDRTYGGPAKLVLPTGAVVVLDRVYLHCAHVEIASRARTIVADAPLPESFDVLARRLGFAHARESFEEAIRCAL